MPKEEWLDIAAAAERYDCSTETIRRRIKNGSLSARTEKVDDRDGRPVLKTLISVVDVDDTFGWMVQEEHVRRIRASAPPLTVKQKIAIRDAFLEYLLEREEKRKSVGAGGARARAAQPRDAFMNRSSFTCPRCQPRPWRGRW